MDENNQETGFPRGGMLNPCEDDIESRLHQSMIIGISLRETRVTFEPAESTDQAAANTAEELDAIHNSGETGHVKRLRDEIRNHISFIHRLMSRYFEAKSAADKEREESIRKELSRWVLPNAPFAGVVRGTLREDYARSSLEPIGLD